MNDETVHRFVAGTAIKRGQSVGFGDNGKLYLTFPHVVESVGVAMRDIDKGETVTFSHGADTDIRSNAILLSE
jgi:predicted RecA/RadA family phage recombinase